MTRCSSAASLAIGALGCALSLTPPCASAESRGALLYSTHCVACHTTQVHWREKRLATDWNSLKAQVRRWQGIASLGWGDDDIVEVTRHLNDSYYHFKQPADLRNAQSTTTLAGQRLP